MVTPCRWGGGCPYLRRRCCLFGHTSGEVAAASLVGLQPPARGSTSEKYDGLVAAVRRLAAAVMWSSGQTVDVPAPQTHQPKDLAEAPVPQIMEDKERIVKEIIEQLANVLAVLEQTVEDARWRMLKPCTSPRRTSRTRWGATLTRSSMWMLWQSPKFPPFRLHRKRWKCHKFNFLTVW